MKKLGNYQPSSSVQKQFRLLTCFCCFSTFFKIWKNFRVLVQALETHLDSFQPSYRDFNNKLHKVSVVLRQIQSFKLLKTVWFGITWVAFLIFALFFWKCSLIEELRRTTFSKFWKCPSLKFSKMVPFDRESWKSYQYEFSAVSEVCDSSYHVFSIR